MLATLLLLTLGFTDTPVEPPASASAPVEREDRVDPAAVLRIELDPATMDLADPRAKQRILVTGYVADRPVDLTDVVVVESSNPAIVAINDRHEAVPVANGETTLRARFGTHEVEAKVTVRNQQAGRLVHFSNEVVPVFTKLGCNSGGCHGKSGGQNGFRLSLLGYDPDGDYDYLVKESRGRRLFPASPERSLLLRKATGGLPHGGGKLLAVEDDKYHLLVAWVRQGMPLGSADEGTVTAIEVFPKARVLRPHAAQWLRVTAHYSDGRSEDVTRFVKFESNNGDVATVDPLGRVVTTSESGESAIMAAFMGQVAVFRATVPTGRVLPAESNFAVRNFVDEHTSRKWNELGLAPSPPADDSQFLRRVYLDLTGQLPPLEVVRTFLQSTEANKREQLIDRLLESPEYASFMAMKWGAILQNKREGRADFAPGTHAMALWLRDAFDQDLPYDSFTRAVLTSTGTPEVDPPVTWYRIVRTPEDNVDNAAQIFLGTRIQCARCHHHPFEKWGQDDYYAFASFFSRVQRKVYETSPTGQNLEVVFVARGGEAKHPKDGRGMPARGLGGDPLKVPVGDDPREALVDWMAHPENPFFAKALVNRLWGHFFARGLVDPIDDMRLTNPPSNPELLDALAADFIGSGFRIKHTIRLMLNSSTYQLSAEPTEFNAEDRQNFARYYPRRLPAEVLVDAVDGVTGVRTSFGLPSEWRAVELPDEGFASYFLDIFGRPGRSSACECERSNEANLGQALHLLNSQEIHDKLTNASGRATQLASDPRADQEKVEELFIRFFARQPRAEELAIALEHLAAKPDKAEAYQNLIWALLNTKEFLFNL